MRAHLVAVGLLAAAIAATGCGGGQADWLAPAQPAEHGFPADLSQRIDSLVAESDLDLRAVLVVADDRLVAERYYHGVTRGRLLHLYSATKSVTGMLTGIALADGTLSGLDETLGEALPHELKARASDRIRAMTLRELLSWLRPATSRGSPPRRGDARSSWPATAANTSRWSHRFGS